MLVSEVLEIVRSKSFGSDDDSEDVQKRNLRYLNMANSELWETVARLDDRYLVKASIVLDFNSQYQVILDTPIQSRLEVFNSDGKPMTEVSQKDLIESQNLKFDKNSFIVYSPISFQLTYSPEQAEATDVSISYLYTPDVKILAENDELNNIYPIRLQYLLADGAFYHLCFAEEGIRTPIQQNKSSATWAKGLSDEKASLMNIKPFSTYGIL